jgi:exo-1,4-beta-D-glucosaminidase
MNVSYADGVYTVEITNNSQYISYMNILKVKDAEGNLVTPAYWSDNFFPLLPGQTKTVTCKVAKAGVAIELNA